ncbi:MAG: TlpA family protein disulfide reductase [Muribaculaceae bacterium]
MNRRQQYAPSEVPQPTDYAENRQGSPAPKNFVARSPEVEQKLKRMKKALLAIVTFAILLIFPSAYSSKTIDSRIGYQAPNFTVSNSDTAVSLQMMRGKYVLLTFWSSDDANSRISNIHYNRVASNNSKVQHLAVNYDRSEKVFDQVTLIDNLLHGTQFHDNQGSESTLHKTYRINEKGYRTVLINPHGEIISENPSDSELASLN